MKKCKLSECGKFITPCDSLSGTLEIGNGASRAKGLYFREYVNMSDGKPSRSMIIIKSGEFKSNGIVANFCPLCGAQIQPEDKS